MPQSPRRRPLCPFSTEVRRSEFTMAPILEMTMVHMDVRSNDVDKEPRSRRGTPTPTLIPALARGGAQEPRGGDKFVVHANDNTLLRYAPR